MKCYILMGSPRHEGNTKALLKPFIEEMEGRGVTCEVDWLYDMNIKGCIACRHCQKDNDKPNCKINDDMQKVFPKVLDSDIIVFATPIYSWYCTAPLKAAMDRMVYAFNKIYGEKMGPRLWEGKKLASIITSGYKPEKAMVFWNGGLEIYAKHSGLMYMGTVGERHKNYSMPFMNQEKVENMVEFANDILGKS